MRSHAAMRAGATLEVARRREEAKEIHLDSESSCLGCGVKEQ
jgi:hypothetical protein